MLFMMQNQKLNVEKLMSGACWAVITRRVGQFVYGFYPEAESVGGLIFHFLQCSLHLLPCYILIFLKENIFLWFSLIYPFFAFILN